jgi:hypothetical protein
MMRTVIPQPPQKAWLVRSSRRRHHGVCMAIRAIDVPGILPAVAERR